jgi:hypothetical protein
MALSFDEIWVYGGQLVVAEPFTTPNALGVGVDKVDWSSFIQGPLQVGQVGDFSSATATTMIGRTDTIYTDRALNTRGNVNIEGDGGTANGLLVSGGSSVDTVYVVGDMYVTGKVDCDNKGRLASRFSSADARPKPFDIQHPSKGEGHRLRYACIEGPEVGVYCRGRIRNENVIGLPKYWKDLVNTQSISVQIQPIGSHQDIIVKRWDDEFVYLQNNGGLPINAFYHVYGERKDINPLIVEYEGDSWKDYPDPNFDPETAPDPEDPNRFNDPQYRGLPNTVTI